MSPTFWTPSEVARLENIPLRSIQSMCQRGEIYPATKVGGMWIIAKAYVIERPARLDPVTKMPIKRNKGRPVGSRDKKPMGRKKKNYRKARKKV